MIILIVGKVASFLAAAVRGHIGFATDNGLDAVILGFLIKVNSTKEVTMVRHRNGGHPVIFHLLKEWSELVGPIKEAILRVKVEVNEF